MSRVMQILVGMLAGVVGGATSGAVIGTFIWMFFGVIGPQYEFQAGIISGLIVGGLILGLAWNLKPFFLGELRRRWSITIGALIGIFLSLLVIDSFLGPNNLAIYTGLFVGWAVGFLSGLLVGLSGIVDRDLDTDRTEAFDKFYERQSGISIREPKSAGTSSPEGLGSRIRWYLGTHSLILSITVMLFVCIGALLAFAYFTSPENGKSSRNKTTALTEEYDEVYEVLRPIEEEVLNLRNLGISELPGLIQMTTDEYHQMLKEFSEPNDQKLLADYHLLLESFNFIDSNYDLEGFLDSPFNEIPGYYVPAENVIVIVTDESEITPVLSLIYAHEFTHALQEHNFGLSTSGNERQLLTLEGDLAKQAFTEGEATLVEALFFESDAFSDSDRQNVIAEFNQSEAEYAEFIETMPPTLLNAGLFPYEEGTRFVAKLYEEGGWESVNEAWENPPRSTEHILHPDRYLAGNELPVNVEVTFPGNPWRTVDTGVLGEFYLREYLSQHLLNYIVNLAATGWGGDQYRIFENLEDGSQAMILRTIWDSDKDLEEFYAAYRRYATLAYSEEGFERSNGGLCWSAEDATCLFQDGDEILIVNGSNLGTVLSIAITQR